MSLDTMDIQALTYERDNRFFFYDIYSGCHVESTAVLNEIVRLAQEDPSEDIFERLKGVYREEQIRGSLDFLTKMHQVRGVFDKTRQNILTGTSSKLKNLWLNIAHDCNMKCVYCFANGGDYKDTKMHMTANRVEECVDYWYDNLGDYKKVNVYFFGGEPFLNREAILCGMKYVDNKLKGSGIKARYSITTNGTLFDERFVEELAQYDTDLIISLDGKAEIHNAQRPLVSGRGSYEIIEKNLERFKTYFPNLSGNIVVTRESAPFLRESVEHLWALGLNRVTFFLSIVENERLSFKEEDLESVFQQIQYLNTATVKNISEHSSGVLENALAICRKIHTNTPYCGCALQNNSSAVFAPDGKMYKCYELMSEKQFRLGHLDHAQKWEHMCKTFLKPLEERACSQCWAYRLCGGGCAYDNHIYNNDINKPYEISCKLIQFLIHEAVRMYSDLYMALPESLDRLFGSKPQA